MARRVIERHEEKREQKREREQSWGREGESDHERGGRAIEREQREPEIVKQRARGSA